MLAGFACVGAAYAGPGADGERPAGVESTSSHVPVLIDDDFVDRLADDSGPVAVSMVDGQGFEPDEHGERITRTFLANTNQARLVQTIGYGRYELGGREIRLFVGNGFIRHALRRGGGIFWTATSDTGTYAPRWYEYWFLENGRPFDKDARAVAAWMQNQNTLFVASVENISRRRDGLPLFCDDFDPQEERGWEPPCGLLRDYIAHSGVGLDKALWVGALAPEPSATGMSFATGAIRADGVFAPHTIYVESPDMSTSHATAVLAAYATNLAYSNPDWGAARLKQELIALAQDEEVRYLEGDADVRGSLIARNRVVKVIRPAFAPKGEPPLTGEPPPPPPRPTVSVASAQALESSGAVVFDVSLSAASSSAVTVDYATADGAGAGGARAGSDYAETKGALTFPAQSTAVRQIRVPVTDDGVYEPQSETFTLTLRNPTNATLAGGGSVLQVVGTIHDDDDGAPMAAFDFSGAACGADLCRAVGGSPVRFTDTSTGKVLTRRWEFGDGASSRGRRPEHAWSEPGFYEVTLWVSDGENESTASRKFLVEASDPAGACVSDAETLCLQDSRYAVHVAWWTAAGESGAGSVVHEGTNDSGLFTFFNRENWEVLIKVLDGCAMNGHVWVYGASTTDLGNSIRVTDTVTGVVKEYRNEPGHPAPAITDGTAFPEGCTR